MQVFLTNVYLVSLTLTYLGLHEMCTSRAKSREVAETVDELNTR